MSKQFLVFGGILIIMCIVIAEPPTEPEKRETHHKLVHVHIEPLPEPEKRETHLRKNPHPDLRGFLALARIKRTEGECGEANDQCTFDQDNCCSGFYCKSSTWSAFCTPIIQVIEGDSVTEAD